MLEYGLLLTQKGTQKDKAINRREVIPAQTQKQTKLRFCVLTCLSRNTPVFVLFFQIARKQRKLIKNKMSLMRMSEFLFHTKQLLISKRIC